MRGKCNCPKCQSTKVRSIDNQPFDHPTKEYCQQEGYAIDNEVYMEAICDECGHKFDIHTQFPIYNTGDLLALKLVIDFLDDGSDLQKSLQKIYDQLC